MELERALVDGLWVHYIYLLIIDDYGMQDGTFVDSAHLSIDGAISAAKKGHRITIKPELINTSDNHQATECVQCMKDHYEKDGTVMHTSRRTIWIERIVVLP